MWNPICKDISLDLKDVDKKYLKKFTTWSKLNKVVSKIIKKRPNKKYKTIVIDTVSESNNM